MVAEEIIDRELTRSEIESIKDLVAENIHWYDAIMYALMEKGIK